MNGKRFVMVQYVGEQELQAPEGATSVCHNSRLNLLDHNPRVNRVVLRFARCKAAAAYSREYDCPRFATFSDALEEADLEWSTKLVHDVEESAILCRGANQCQYLEFR